MKRKFRKGNVVICGGTGLVVLVTGPSDHKEYKSFSGVVIASEKGEDEDIQPIERILKLGQ